jgi:hypothetical protein
VVVPCPAPPPGWPFAVWSGRGIGCPCLAAFPLGRPVGGSQRAANGFSRRRVSLDPKVKHIVSVLVLGQP